MVKRKTFEDIISEDLTNARNQQRKKEMNKRLEEARMKMAKRMKRMNQPLSKRSGKKVMPKVNVKQGIKTLWDVI